MKKFYVILLTLFTLTFVGCSNQTHNSKKFPEKTLNTYQLCDMSNSNISYTKDNGLVTTASINNINATINELYNDNTKTYYYYLTMEENIPITTTETVIQFKTIRINIGTLPSSDTNTFTLSASSPIFIETLETNFSNKSLFLFSSENSLMDEEFRIELVFVNEIPYDNYENNTKTFRYIFGNTNPGTKDKSHSWSILTE